MSVGRKQELGGIRLSLSDAKFPFKLPRQVVPDTTRLIQLVLQARSTRLTVSPSVRPFLFFLK